MIGKTKLHRVAVEGSNACKVKIASWLSYSLLSVNPTKFECVIFLIKPLLSSDQLLPLSLCLFSLEQVLPKLTLALHLVALCSIVTSQCSEVGKIVDFINRHYKEFFLSCSLLCLCHQFKACCNNLWHCKFSNNGVTVGTLRAIWYGDSWRCISLNSLLLWIARRIELVF